MLPTLQHPDVRQRIGIQNQHVGEFAGLDKPQFTFQEEPRSDWLARVSTGLGGMLAFSAVIGCWALLSLRPRRLGAAIG